MKNIEQNQTRAQRGVQIINPRLDSKPDSLPSEAAVDAIADILHAVCWDSDELGAEDLLSQAKQRFLHECESKAPAVTGPRAYTLEEARDLFIRHVRAMVDYWDNTVRASTQRDRISGCAHSILATLDGTCAALPGFRVSPQPHPNDKAYCISHGENWFPEDDCDIAGELRRQLYRGWR